MSLRRNREFRDGPWSKYIPATVWFIFFVCVIAGPFLQFYNNSEYSYLSGCTNTIIILERLEENYDLKDEKILVYKYKVNNEKYTYKVSVPKDGIFDNGACCRVYYDSNNPTHIEESEIIISIQDLGVAIFFLVSLDLALLGALIEKSSIIATYLSFIPFTLLCASYGVYFIASQIMIPQIGIGEIVFAVIYGLAFIIAGVYSLTCIIKEIKYLMKKMKDERQLL